MKKERPIVNKIFERDIDLLLMEEFKCDPAFLQLFVKETGWPDCPYDPDLIETYHSEYMENGEADVVVMLNYPNGVRRALLIEDKINAPTQQEQSQRYTRNGKLLLEKDGVAAVKTFLVAPEKYLFDHAADGNATDFEIRISYEDLLSFFISKNEPRFSNKIKLLQFAVEKQKRGSDKVVDPKITEFWRQMSEYVNQHYSELEFVSKTIEKSKNDEYWMDWYSPIKGAKIYWKADHGYIDVQIEKCGSRVNEFWRKFNNKLLPGMRIEKAGGSVVFRMENSRCWKMEFSGDFEENIQRIDHALSYASLVFNFMKTLSKDVFEQKEG